MVVRTSFVFWAIALAGLGLVVQRCEAADSLWTPGRLREAERALDELNEESLRALGRSSRSEKGSRAVGPDTAAGTAIGSDDLWALPDSSQLLFQSIPSFPDAEMRALSNWAGLLRTPASDSKDTSSKDTSSAADDFIEALLKTTRARLLDPSLRHSHRPVHSPRGSAAAPAQPVHMDSATSTSSSSTGEDVPDAGSSNDNSDDSDPDQDADAADGDSSSEGSSTDAPSTEGAAETSLATDDQQQHISTDLLPAAQQQEQEDPSSQRIADTDSAVEGQVLVTQAEIIPAMQSYGQVVLTSLKMRPMPAHELVRKTASVLRGDAPAAVQAAAWQDNLKQALEAAVALETNTSTAQMHTRMTSIINLGLELAEPPVAYASAAANAVANSIKALTGDDSGVLVGVSLIRLGPQAHTHSAGAAANSSSGGRGKRAAARSSMLAMLTLYGVGAPSNAVQIAQRMQQACPDLYSASLANSTCGRSIISSVVAAVLAAESADKAARSSPAAAAGNPPAAPSRTLLQQQPGLSLSSSVSARGRSFTTSLKATFGSSPAVSAQPAVSQSRSAVALSSAGQQAAEARLSPEMGSFIQHSQSCLRVRQQPEVNIIITQAVGVTQAQQAGPLADKLQLLSASPTMAELLALSGLTLAQAGKPQTIDLSAAALAAAGLDRGGTLAAASALGSEAAALGHSWGSGGSSRDSSSSTAGTKRDGSSVAAPALIGIAVAVAVSVVAVCIAAVAIVVVKQRAKQARAAAAVDEQQLPKSSKRRRSNKGKGVSSKYLPTSHAALAGSSSSGGSDGIPPPPCVIVTAVSSPCQHSTPGQSPCKPSVPGLRPAPLASAGSSALLSLGSGPATGASGAVSTPLAYAGMLGPAVTRGDSVSSAIMAEFAEQRQQLRAEVGDEGGKEEEEEVAEAGSEVWPQEQQQQQQWWQQDQDRAVRGTAALAGASPSSSSGTGSRSPLRTLRRPPQAAGVFTRAGPDSPQGFAHSPTHRLDGSSSCSSPAWSRLALSLPSKRHRPDPTAEGAAGTPGSCWDADEDSVAASDGMRSVFSRPLSESSLPDDLRCSHMAAAAAGEGPPVAAAPHNSGSDGVGQQRSSHASALPTLRTLHSAGSGQHPEQPSSRGSCGNGTPVRANPFMSAYDMSVLLCAASSGSVSQPAGAAALPSSSLAGSSTNQIPQWASSLASSSLGAAIAPAGLTGSFGSDGASAFCVGSSSVQHHSGPLQGQQQQGERQRLRRAAAGSVRVTPFMRPGNIPPGFE